MAARRSGAGRPKKDRAARRRAAQQPARSTPAKAVGPAAGESRSEILQKPTELASDVVAADEPTALDDVQGNGAQAPVADEQSAPLEDELPEASESMFKLPDLPSGARGVRRRRRRKQQAAASTSDVDKNKIGPGAFNDEALPMSEIERLTKAYRAGGEAARELVSRIEVEPDFMFRDGQATGEYELAAAIIGTGRPNKQGLYVLPYLQSSHTILLIVILLGTFVYYPGFPLTEGSEELRAACKIGLALTYAVNLGLAVYSYAEARRRNQPPLFWFMKVALFGNIALQELRSNAPLDTDTSKLSKNPKRKPKRVKK